MNDPFKYIAYYRKIEGLSIQDQKKIINQKHGQDILMREFISTKPSNKKTCMQHDYRMFRKAAKWGIKNEVSNLLCIEYHSPKAWEIAYYSTIIFFSF